MFYDNWGHPMSYKTEYMENVDQTIVLAKFALVPHGGTPGPPNELQEGIYKKC